MGLTCIRAVLKPIWHREIRDKKYFPFIKKLHVLTNVAGGRIFVFVRRTITKLVHNMKESPLYPSSLEDNLKKALTELLVLKLLSVRDYYIGELTRQIKEKSGGALVIVFPYGAIYRMTRSGYIAESKKRNAPDGRLRQYYTITDKGREYLAQLMEEYAHVAEGVDNVLHLPGE